MSTKRVIDGGLTMVVSLHGELPFPGKAMTLRPQSSTILEVQPYIELKICGKRRFPGLIKFTLFISFKKKCLIWLVDGKWLSVMETVTHSPMHVPFSALVIPFGQRSTHL